MVAQNALRATIAAYMAHRDPARAASLKARLDGLDGMLGALSGGGSDQLQVLVDPRA